MTRTGMADAVRHAGGLQSSHGQLQLGAGLGMLPCHAPRRSAAQYPLLQCCESSLEMLLSSDCTSCLLPVHLQSLNAMLPLPLLLLPLPSEQCVRVAAAGSM